MCIIQMDPYKKAKEWWKFECYRLHVATKQNEEQIKEIDAKIESLEATKASLESTTIVPFRTKDGKNVKKLRELLQFEDDTMARINSAYKPPKESYKRSGRYFVKFIEVLFS